MKPKHQRLLFIVASMALLCAGVLFTLSAFRENLVFFYSPSEIAAKPPEPTKNIRVGGLVKAGSIERGADDKINFILTDGAAEIRVSYQGMLPNLFRDGQGCIAEGKMISGTDFAAEFVAEKILAKHDEKYMPKEVVDALKKSGNWHGDSAVKEVGR